MVSLEAKAVWLIALAVGLAAAAFIPTTYTHRLLLASEDPKYIRRVYAEHTVGQTFHTKYPTDIIRILVRGYRSATQSLRATVDNQLLETSVTLTEQDQWVELPLVQPLPVGEHQFTLSAPDIHAQSDAILVRFQVSSTLFEPGSMEVNGAASYGDLALELTDRIPAWLQIVRYFVHHPSHTIHTYRALTLGFVLTTLAFVLPHSKKSWRMYLLALFVAAVAIRIPTLAAIDGVFGGDAFNYLSKGKAWISGDDPFNAEPRKGPFLPFLLIPTLLTDNPILWSRFMGAICAGITAAAVALTLKRLRLSPALSLLGGLLVAVNREFWWESLNGLANVPYAALIALTTLSYTANTPFATSLAAALTALTRYEGILVGAIYIPALWVRNRFRLSTLRPLLIPLILLAIPFVFWPISGALGIRTASDITSDTGLYIAWDWGDYLSNLDRFKAYIQELWFYKYEPPLKYLTWAIYVGVAAGALALLRRRPATGIPLLLVTILQIAAVTAILPKTRYYVQIIPLLAVALMYGIYLLPRRVAVVVASLLVASVAVNAHNHLPEFIEDYNYRARSDSVLIQASVFLKKIDSRPAFATNFFSVETYFPLSQVIMGAPENPDEQLGWLKDKQATHIVETTEMPRFTKLLEKYPDKFERVTSFKASYDPAQATIYRITNL